MTQWRQNVVSRTWKDLTQRIMGGVHGRRNEIESTLVIGNQKQEERRIQQFEHEES